VNSPTLITAKAGIKDLPKYALKIEVQKKQQLYEQMLLFL